MLKVALESSLKERMVAPPLPISVPHSRACTSMRSVSSVSLSLACTAGRGGGQEQLGAGPLNRGKRKREATPAFFAVEHA